MKNEKGVAFILALFSMAVLSLLVIALLDTITIDWQILGNQQRMLKATFIAYAGVENAIYELRQDDSYSGTGGSVEFPAGSGNTYDVTVSGGTITSTGIVRGQTRTVEAYYSLKGSSDPYKVTVNAWKEL